jgi:hypothetical protein
LQGLQSLGRANLPENCPTYIGSSFLRVDGPALSCLEPKNERNTEDRHSLDDRKKQVVLSITLPWLIPSETYTHKKYPARDII